MKNWYELRDNGIEILSGVDFNPKHIFECGQVFDYTVNENGEYTVFTGPKKAVIKPKGEGFFIETNDVKFFEEYFDLKTDYGRIKRKLATEFLKDAVAFGSGIRILRQPTEEVIFSFIISANNNIKRIQGIIRAIKASVGAEKSDGSFVFPSASELAKHDEAFYKKLGLGYRAAYIVKTAKTLAKSGVKHFTTMDTKSARAELEKLAGVGPKVADCILLFGLHRKDVFPVDVWINKVYNDNYFCGERNRKQIADFFVTRFKDLAGYAQQYLFYYKREFVRINRK